MLQSGARLTGNAAYVGLWVSSIAKRAGPSTPLPARLLCCNVRCHACGCQAWSHVCSFVGMCMYSSRVWKAPDDFCSHGGVWVPLCASAVIRISVLCGSVRVCSCGLLTRLCYGAAAPMRLICSVLSVSAHVAFSTGLLQYILMSAPDSGPLLRRMG